MIVIYINGEGTAKKLSPEHIYQGSNQTGVLVFAPTPPQTPMGIAFKLPDGTCTPYYHMTPRGNYEGLSQYEFTLPTSITQLAGQAAIALQATFSDGRQNSQFVDFEIEPSVVVLPPELTPKAYTVLEQAITQNTLNIRTNTTAIAENAEAIKNNADAIKENSAKIVTNTEDITTLQGQIGNIEELSEQAQKASVNAVETANQAKETADSLADSIAQANDTARQAVDTANGAVDTANGAVDIANEAKSAADGLADSIAQANSTANEAKEIAEEALEQSKVTGTKVNIDGQFATEVNFDSAPQGQLNGKVNKSGDTMTGDLTVEKPQSGARFIAKTSKNGEGIQIGVNGDDASTGIWDLKREKWLMQNRDGTVYIDGKVPLPLSGGTMTGELHLSNQQVARGYRQVVAGTDLSTEQSGLFSNGYSNYSKYILVGDGGDKIAIGYEFSYDNPGFNFKVYNSGNLEKDAKIPYFETAKLEPTTANGWTVGDSNLVLPGAGVYLVSINGSDIGILVFHKISPSTLWATTSFVVPSPKTVGVCMVGRYLSYSSGVGLWQAAETNGNQPDVTSVAYKKLA